MSTMHSTPAQSTKDSTTAGARKPAARISAEGIHDGTVGTATPTPAPLVAAVDEDVLPAVMLLRRALDARIVPD